LTFRPVSQRAKASYQSLGSGWFQVASAGLTGPNAAIVAVTANSTARRLIGQPPVAGVLCDALSAAESFATRRTSMSVSASPLATVLVRNVISHEISFASIHHPAQLTERETVHVVSVHCVPFQGVNIQNLSGRVVDAANPRADLERGKPCRPGEPRREKHRRA
jgi:hypothetical protein